MPNKRKFWRWKNIAGSEEAERELVMDGTIADVSWFEDDITPKMFRDELLKGSGPVTVRLNSPGGDCIAASQIYTMLRDYKGRVTVKIDGIAASAASVVAMAGDTVIMAPTSLIMIHDPMTIAMGNREDLEAAIDMLNEVKESIINAYQIKTGLSRAKISSLMSDETWLNARKALQLHFCDSILGDKELPDEDEEEEENAGEEETPAEPEQEPEEESEEETPESDEEEPEEGPDEDEEEEKKKASAAYSFSEKHQMTALLGAMKKSNPAATGRKVSDLMARLELIKR